MGGHDPVLIGIRGTLKIQSFLLNKRLCEPSLRTESIQVVLLFPNIVNGAIGRAIPTLVSWLVSELTRLPVNLVAIPARELLLLQ